MCKTPREFVDEAVNRVNDSIILEARDLEDYQRELFFRELHFRLELYLEVIYRNPEMIFGEEILPPTIPSPPLKDWRAEQQKMRQQQKDNGCEPHILSMFYNP